jgi:hypothetical protein
VSTQITRERSLAISVLTKKKTAIRAHQLLFRVHMGKFIPCSAIKRQRNKGVCVATRIPQITGICKKVDFHGRWRTVVRSALSIESFLESLNSRQHFIKGRRIVEEHFSPHGLIIPPPAVLMLRRRRQPIISPTIRRPAA